MGRLSDLENKFLSTDTEELTPDIVGSLKSQTQTPEIETLSRSEMERS